MNERIRLDEQFRIEARDPLAPTLRGLLRTMETRFRILEAMRDDYERAINEFKTAALERIEVELRPASEAIVSYATLGFLIAESSTAASLAQNAMIRLIVDAGPNRDLFTPTLYLGLQHDGDVNNFAIARVESWNVQTGALHLELLAVYGAPGAHAPWTISAAPGVTDVTRIYYERAMFAAAQAEAEAVKAQADWGAMDGVAAALREAGPNLFVWRDGSRPHQNILTGVAPSATANDDTLTTSAWTRARVAEGVDSLGYGAPETMNSLTKLADSIGRDTNFAGTVDARLASKFDKAGGSIGALTVNGDVTVNGNLDTTYGDVTITEWGQNVGTVYLGGWGAYFHWNGGGYHTHLGEVYGTWNLNMSNNENNYANAAVNYISNNFANGMRATYNHDARILGSQGEWNPCIVSGCWQSGGGIYARYRTIQYAIPNAGWYNSHWGS